MRVLLAGGGSGGSAAPVIAVAEAIRERVPDAAFLYVTTTGGPERAMVDASGLPSATIRTGRLRRYATWRNAVDPALVATGMAQAVGLVRGFRPNVAFAAGGFAGVPPLMAARLARVPIIIHQQDVQPGLANRMLAPFAAKRTIALDDTRAWRRWAEAEVVGNPVRSDVFRGSAERARELFDLAPELPVVLITGGGTGAMRLNEIAAEASEGLVGACQIIHLTGAGKSLPGPRNPAYHQFDFLADEMTHALAVADIVVSRSGMSTLAEIGALGKAAIVVPMPSSHQVLNATAFARRDAAEVLSESALTGQELTARVMDLLADETRRKTLAGNASVALPPHAADVIAERLLAVAT